MSYSRWHRERDRARRDAQRGYDPNQPRWPEGTPIAGQWMDIPGLGDDVPVMFGGSAMDKVDLTEDDPRNEVEVMRMLNRQKNDFEALPGSARVWVFHGGSGGSGSAREHTYVTMNPYLAARFSKGGEVRAYSVVKQDMEPTPEALRVDGVNTTAESLFDTGEAMVRRDLTGEAILLDREKRIPDQLREAVAKPPAPTTPLGPGPGSDQLPSAQPGGGPAAPPNEPVEAVVPTPAPQAGDDPLGDAAALARSNAGLGHGTAIELGKQIMARVNRRGEFAAQKRKLKKLQRQVKDLTNRKYDLLDALPSPGDPDDPEYAERVRERGATLDAIERINVEKQGVYAQMREVSPNLAGLRREAVVRELRAIRPGFGTGQLDPRTRDLSQDGAFADFERVVPPLVPREWIEASGARYGMSIRDIGSEHPEGRAYYQNDRTATVAGYTAVLAAAELYLGTKTGEARDSVALHEFAHRAEAVSPEQANGLTKIVNAEMGFHRERTAGDPEVAIHGRPDERGRPDRYYSEYVGREYRDATEVLSMGLEGLFFGKGDAWEKDPEHLQFVLGLLAAA